MSLDTLDKLPGCDGNHPSWNELHAHDSPPAHGLLQEQVDAGFALLYEDKEAAEAAFGSESVSSSDGQRGQAERRWHVEVSRDSGPAREPR